MLSRLVTRLGSPLLASSLSKEQLCLALSALSQLFPPRPLSTSRVTASSTDLLLSSVITETNALAVRARRIAPVCTAMEIGMLASGSVALQWRRFDVVESFIKELYHRCCEHRQATVASTSNTRGRPRLLDVTRVVHAALAAELYCNATLRLILVEHTPHLATSRDDATIVTDFLSAAHIYLGSGGTPADDAFSAAWADKARDSPSVAAGLEVFQARVNAGDFAAPLTSRQRLLEKYRCIDTASETTSNGNAAAAARYKLFTYSHTTPASAEDVAELLQHYVHFSIEDAVILQQLEERALSCLESSDTVSRDAVRQIESAAYGNPHRLQSLHHFLCRRNKSAEEQLHSHASESEGSLTRVGPAAAAYMSMRRGSRIAESDLFNITESLNMSDADAVAQAACVFAEAKGSVPESILAQLRRVLPDVSLAGTAALLRAGRRNCDGNSNILLIAEMAMRRVSDTPLRSMVASSPSALREMICALVLPRNRFANETELFIQSEKRLVEAIVGHLLDVGDTMPLDDLISLCTLASPLDRRNDLALFACSRAAQAKEALSHTEMIASVELMAASDLIHTPLVARITTHYGSLADQCLTLSQEGGDCTATLPTQLLQMCAAHHRLDVPDWETIAHRVLHYVDQNTSLCAAELLIAAGYLATLTQRIGLLERVQQTLRGKVDTGDLPADTLILAIGMVTISRSADALLVASLIKATSAVLVSPINSERPVLPCVGELIGVHCALNATNDGAGAAIIPESVVRYAEEHLAVCSGATFCRLCSHAFKGQLPNSFSNALVECLPRQLNNMTADQIASSTWGLGQLPDAGQRLTHQLVTEQVSDYVVDNAELFWSGPSIARLLHGLSRFHCTKRSVYSVFSQRLNLRAVRATLNRESVSLALSAFSTVKFLDKNLVDRLANVFMKHAPELEAADLLLSVKAHSRMMLLNDPFYEEIGQQIARRHEEFPLMAKCDILHAFGTVQQENSRVASTLLRDVVSQLDHLPDGGVKAAVDVLVSLWLMNYPITESEDAVKLTTHIVEKGELLSSGSIMKLCSVLRDLEWKNMPLLQAVGDHSVRLKLEESLEPETARAALDVLGKFRFHHEAARQEVAQIARSVSKEVTMLSQEESEEMEMLLAR